MLLLQLCLSAPVSWQQCDPQWKINLFIFIFLLLYKSVYAVKLCHLCTAPLHHWSFNIKSLMKWRPQCLSSSLVHFFHLLGDFLAACGVTSRSERTRSCCRNSLAPPNLDGRCHRASSQVFHLREVLTSLIPEPQKSSRLNTVVSMWQRKELLVS